MIPTATDLDTLIKNWNKKKRIHIDLELTLNNRKRVIGKAICYSPNRKVRIISKLSGWWEFIEIPYTTDINIIHKAWEDCMNQLLKKLFK